MSVSSLPFKQRNDAPVLSTSIASTWGLVVLLTAVGAYLRLANLGALGFRWDEDLMSLATKAILEHGTPELPSGMVYLRGTWLLYLMAGSAWLLGFSEFALRLPPALFGIALIPLAFMFARALFGPRVGLVAAALMTLSFWDIEISRNARMYAPFAFFYLTTVLLIWRYRVERESLSGGIAAVASAIVALSLHQLGYTLVFAFLLPLVVRAEPVFENPRRFVFPLLAALIVGSCFLIGNGVQDYYRNLPLIAAQGLESDASAAILERAGETTASRWGDMLPSAPLVAALVERSPAAFAALVLGVAVVLGWYLRSKIVRGGMQGASDSSPRSLITLDVALLCAVAACVALQLFNVALLMLALLAFSKRRGLAAIHDRDVQFAVASIAVALPVWLAVALGFQLLDATDAGSALKLTLKALLDYPRFFSFWAFVDEWPLAALVAGVGALWAFDRAARLPAQPASLFLLLIMVIPLVVNGLFETPYEMFRYSAPLDTFFFTFVALGILRWQDVLAILWPRRRTQWSGVRHSAIGVAGSIVASAIVLAVHFNPVRSFALTERQYSATSGSKWFGLGKYGDFKTPAAFVACEASPDDTIIVFDTREYFNYLGRLSYWVATTDYESQIYEIDGKAYDAYVGTPLLASVSELDRVLTAPGTKWLIASEPRIAESRILTDDVRQYVEAQRGRTVYVGLDGVTRVYRFDAADSTPLATTAQVSVAARESVEECPRSLPTILSSQR